MTTHTELKKCGQCLTKYDPATRRHTCPHESLIREPEYFTNMKIGGRPYKLDPARFAKEQGNETAAQSDGPSEAIPSPAE